MGHWKPSINPGVVVLIGGVAQGFYTELDFEGFAGVGADGAITLRSTASNISESFHDTGVSGVRYLPWGNVVEQTVGLTAPTNVAWLPPFGADTIIEQVRLFCEDIGGSTDLQLFELDETPIGSPVTVNMAAAQTIYTFDLNDYRCTGDPIMVGFDPDTATNRCRAQLFYRNEPA